MASPIARSGAVTTSDHAGTERGPSARTSARWFGPEERPLLGWLSTPDGAVTESGVLVLAPVGYPYWSTHRTLRVIAERLAVAGHTVLRFDYDGTGDSSGDQWDGGRVAAWRSSAAAAVDELRTLGCRRLVLAGVRVGGLLALLDGAAAGADAVVAWEPVTSGRRYAKEVRLLATAVPDGPGSPPGTMVAAGIVFTAQTLEDLAALHLDELDLAPAPRALIVGEHEDRHLLERLRGLGCDTEYRAVSDGAGALEVPAEDAAVPLGVVEAICDWVGPAPPAAVARPPERRRAKLSADVAALSEEVLELGADRLVGVVTEADGLPATAPTVVFLNCGSEPHIGSGRAWVEYARALGMLGYRCLRTDFRGWGESPDDNLAPGRPYDAHCEQDTVAMIRALRARGNDHLVLVGLCAGAWVALRAVLAEGVDGVIALNPQLYWQPGDPVEALMSQTRLRRTAEREREARGAGNGLWTALDRLGRRPWAGRWLDDLMAAGIPVSMLFAQGDDGLEYLNNRLARRLAAAQRSGIVRVVELAEIDHSMHRAWLRDRVVSAMRAELELFAGREGWGGA